MREIIVNLLVAIKTYGIEDYLLTLIRKVLHLIEENSGEMVDHLSELFKFLFSQFNKDKGY
jgi:hypothetical protein